MKLHVSWPPGVSWATREECEVANAELLRELREMEGTTGAESFEDVARDVRTAMQRLLGRHPEWRSV